MEPSEPQPRRPPAAVPEGDPRLEPFRLLVGIVDRLRAPDGCAWDRKQTLASMAKHVVEETFELLEAIEDGADAAVVEETGDVLMNVALVCRIAEDEGRFDLGRVAAEVAEKLVRRHPHVFGDTSAGDAVEALASWEAAKRSERANGDGDGAADTSALAGIPRGLPALQRAARTAGKAISAGFRWQNAAGAQAQLRSELTELDEVLTGADLESTATGPTQLAGELAGRAEEELGDVLFAAACLGAYLGVDPERACRRAVRRFEERFRRLEGELDGPLERYSTEELVTRWRRGRE